MIVSDLISAIQGPDERSNKFSQQFQKIWSMILEPLTENHVISMFIHNINPKMKFQVLDYMTLPFTKIIKKLTQKDKCLVEIGDLKYGNPNKEKREADIIKKRIKRSML